MSSTLRRFSWRWVTIFTGLHAENNQKFVYKAPIEKHPRNSLSCSNRHQSEKFFYLSVFAFSVKTKTFCSIISICQPGYESKSRPREIQIASDELIHIILAFSFCYITTLRNHLILFTVYFLARLMLFCLVRESQTRRNGLQSYLYLFSRNEVIAFWRIVNLVSDKILKFRPSVSLIEYLFRKMLVMIFDKVEQEIKFTARAIDRRFVVVCQLWLTNMLILIFWCVTSLKIFTGRSYILSPFESSRWELLKEICVFRFWSSTLVLFALCS